MPTISLSDPAGGTTSDANQIASNNGILETLLNGGLDNTNITAAAAIAISKLAAYPSDATKFLKGDGTWEAPVYSSFTPTFDQGGALTTSGLVGRYRVYGKVVFAYGQATLTSAGVGGNNFGIGGLPVASFTSLTATGTVFYGDTGSAYYVGCPFGASSTSFYMQVSGEGNHLGLTPAVTVANGDTVAFSLTYEAA